MTDIVKRLRRYEAERDPDVSIEAADEIERLRKIEAAARLLVKVNDPIGTMQAFTALKEALK